MSLPPYSVIMSVYGGDRPEWLAAAVSSILCQKPEPDQIVLTVDGPLPEAVEKQVQELEKVLEILTLVRLPVNQGLGPALAAALAVCRNELAARMDSDDLCVPGRFRSQLECFARDPALSLVGGDILEFVSDPAEPVSRRAVPRSDREIKAEMRLRCPLNHVTVMFRKSEVMKAGGYQSWPYNEDYSLWVRMALCGAKFKNLARPLVCVRVGPDTWRRRGGLKYFRSEEGVQRLMLKAGLIHLSRYLVNVGLRFFVQVLLPGRLRGSLYRRFAREEAVRA